jgi:xanthine dehydrogenase accessory factor
MTKLSEVTIAIKGAGEMASAVAWRLHMANLKKIVMLETANPLAVRREVSFCEAVHDGKKSIEGVNAALVQRPDEIKLCWHKNYIAVVVDPQWKILDKMRFDVLVDAILAKKNLGTNMDAASAVIGLGPGFQAGRDVHLVIETNRGHNLGRIITAGGAELNTGIPGAMLGFTKERVLRAPADGVFQTQRNIGEFVKVDEIVGSVARIDVRTQIEGILRGLIRPKSQVFSGLKIGDIDPRGERSYCYTISDKARAIGGSVLEAVLRFYN